jgi:OOP family OmpA-OmpF porin
VIEDDGPGTKTATAVMDDSDWRIGDDILEVEQTERGWDVHFDFNKFLLNDGQIEYLYQVVIPMLRDNPNMELVLEGHTDSRGSDEVNYRMAVLRISNVLYHIEMAGVEDTRLKVVPKGESAPIGDNGTAEGRAKNRRVEIIKVE